MLSNIFGWEFLEEYKKGKRTFSDLHMQFSDLTGSDLQDTIIKNSKLEFVLLRESKLKNVRFIDCELFFCGFRNAEMTGVIFDNCKIDYGYFEHALFDNTKMLKCHLNWCGMFFANIGSLDTSSSTLFKVFTDISQLSQKDINDAYMGLIPFVQNLDFEMRALIQDRLKNVTTKLGIKPTTLQASPKYEQEGSDYSKPGSAYQNLGDMMEQLIGAYASKKPYKSNTPYEKKGEYKK